MSREHQALNSQGRQVSPEHRDKALLKAISHLRNISHLKAKNTENPGVSRTDQALNSQGCQVSPEDRVSPEHRDKTLLKAISHLRDMNRLKPKNTENPGKSRDSRYTHVTFPVTPASCSTKPSGCGGLCLWGFLPQITV